jgi:hypothetical protein
VIATPSAAPPTSPRNRAMASVEGGQFLAVELDPAVHDRGAHRYGLDQVRRPAEHGPDAVGGRPANPDHRHPLQVPALQDGIGRVGGAEHDVADPAGVGAGRPEHGVDGGHDPGGDIGAARSRAPSLPLDMHLGDDVNDGHVTC